MVSLVKKLNVGKISIEENTSKEIINYWQKRKERLRIIISVLFVSLIIFGLEKASPNYSLSGIFSEYVVKNSDLLQSIIENKNAIVSFFISDIDELFLKNPIKYSVFFGIIIIVLYKVIYEDPLSKTEYLAKIYNEESSARWKYPELNFYASILPSNNLHTKCGTCINGNCTNRIDKGDKLQLTKWGKIFPNLNQSTVYNILEATHKCRKALFLKYGFFLSGFFLLAIYILSRFFENFHLEFTNHNYPLLLLVGAYLFLSFWFSHSKKISLGQDPELTGPWISFGQAIENLHTSVDYHEQFEKYICNYQIRHGKYKPSKDKTAVSLIPSEIYETDITKLSFTLDILNDHVRKKSAKFLAGEIENYHSGNAPIEDLLEALHLLYCSLHDNIKFRAAVFVFDEEDEKLTPWIYCHSDGFEFRSINDQGLCKIPDQEIDIKKSLAYKSAIEKLPFCGSGKEIEIYNGQNEHLKSIHTYPVCFDEKQQEALGDVGIELSNCFAVISIDSDNENVFSTENKFLNDLTIKNFAERILFETSLTIHKLRFSEGGSHV